MQGAWLLSGRFLYKTVSYVFQTLIYKIAIEQNRSYVLNLESYRCLIFSSWGEELLAVLTGSGVPAWSSGFATLDTLTEIIPFYVTAEGGLTV